MDWEFYFWGFSSFEMFFNLVYDVWILVLFLYYYDELIYFNFCFIYKWVICVVIESKRFRDVWFCVLDIFYYLVEIYKCFKSILIFLCYFVKIDIKLLKRIVIWIIN